MLLCFSMYSKQALEFCHYSIEIKTNKIGPQSKKTIENIRKDNKFFLPNQVLENNTISERGQEERTKESSRKSWDTKQSGPLNLSILFYMKLQILQSSVLVIWNFQV